MRIHMVYSNMFLLNICSLFLIKYKVTICLSNKRSMNISGICPTETQKKLSLSSQTEIYNFTVYKFREIIHLNSLDVHSSINKHKKQNRKNMNFETYHHRFTKDLYIVDSLTFIKIHSTS